jgi:excisionase family DNA binding protein
MVIRDISYLLTLSEAADACRVTPGTIRRWVKTGKLDAVTLPGGTYRIRHEDLARLIQVAHESDRGG